MIGPKKNGFSNTEVGALVENLRDEFRAIAEVVSPLREDMADVKYRLSAVEGELRSLKDVVRVAVPSLSTRVSALEIKAGTA